MNCPICNKKAEARYRPFCSSRCADRDLGNWFNQRYSVPSEEPVDIDEDADKAENRRNMLH